MRYSLATAFLISFVLSYALSFSYYWYLIFLPEIIVGLFLVQSAKGSFLIGFAAALGTAVQILSYNGSFRVSESALVANIAGIPGGSVTFLVFTGIIVLVVASLGSVIGVSISPMLKKVEEKK